MVFVIHLEQHIANNISIIQSGAKPKLRVAEVDVNGTAKVIRKHVTAKSLFESSMVTYERLGESWFRILITLAANTQNYELDFNAYQKAVKDNERVVRQELEGIFGSGRSALVYFSEYINKKSNQTTRYYEEMARFREKVFKHNQSIINRLAIAGKTVSMVRFGADVGVSILSSGTGTGMGISHLYNITTETITVASDARNADVWSFKGSLAAPKLMIWSELAKKNVEGKLRVGGPEVVGIIFAAVDLKDNLNKFD
jgi:hypothetical protein